MESDNGTVARITHDVGQHLRRTQLLAIIAGDEIPHHDAVRPFQPHVLRPAHMAVRRTKQRTEIRWQRRQFSFLPQLLHQTVGLQRIFQVTTGRKIPFAETAYMVERVVADAVPTLHHLPKHLRMLAHVIAYHEKRRFNAVTLQHIEYPGSDDRDGAVIKRQIDGLLFRIHTPQSARI